MKIITLSILTILLSFFTPYSTEMEVVFKNEGVKISTNSEFEVLEFNPEHFEFGVNEGKPTNSNFYINSNFFGKDGTPIGLVVVEGDKKSSRTKWRKSGKDRGGYFYVKDGKPYVRSKYCPSYTEYSTQTILWGIDNGTINTPLLKTAHAQLNRYRTLIGENKKGEIIVIVSKIQLDINTILNFGIEYKLVDGLLFDGGSSVDYYFNNGEYSSTFKAMNNNLKSILGIDQPPIYISGNFK